MNHGSFPLAHFHALSDDAQQGEFEAVVSTFNTPVEGIFYDQILRPGCFTRTLAERGYPAIVWSHEWDTPPIGQALEAKETEEGLQIRGRLFVADGEDHPIARQVYTAMRAQGGDSRNVLREFSIGFEIVEAEWEVHDEDEVLAIKDLHLFECGPCLVGRNVSRLIEVASAEDRRQVAEEKSDPVLARFPRPARQAGPAEQFRELATARPGHVAHKEG